MDDVTRIRKARTVGDVLDLGKLEIPIQSYNDKSLDDLSQATGRGAKGQGP